MFLRQFNKRALFNQSMKYMIQCLLKGPVEQYHHNLVDEIYQKFGLNITKEENLATHFTLKYFFETKNIDDVDKSVQLFCETHKKTPVRVGGFGKFFPKTVFLNVILSDEAKKTFLELIVELKKIDWLSWNVFDGERLHFHTTLAQDCNEKCTDVWNFIQGKEEYFDCFFDNVTILKMTGENDSVKTWEIHKSVSMG